WYDMGLASRFGKERADELKKLNTRTYQEYLFTMFGLEFAGQEYLMGHAPRAASPRRVGVEARADPRWQWKRWVRYPELVERRRIRPEPRCPARTPLQARPPRSQAPWHPPRDRPAVRGWSVARLALALALLAVGILSRARYFDWCIHDDAFISFRYARNLVRGTGLVMNPGERVEGISNFLWTLLSVPVLALGKDPARAAQVLVAALS